MKTRSPLYRTPSILIALLSSVTVPIAQTAPSQGRGVQSARDAREPQVLATCKHLAPLVTFKASPGFKPPSGEAHDYSINAIRGVIASGARWKTLWSVDGNNADGIVATSDGVLLIAQNSNSAVIQLDQNGKETVLFRDTNTGGALSISKSGALFIVQRGLHPSIWQLRPERRLLANQYRDDPLDCLRTVINDLAADSRFIPTPYPVISVAFGGPRKKTLYAVAATGKSPAQAAAILTVPMIAAGYPGRAK